VIFQESILTSHDLSARTSEYLHRTKTIQNGLSCICEQDYTSSVRLSHTAINRSSIKLEN